MNKITWQIILWTFMVFFIFDYHWYDIHWIDALMSSVLEVLTYAGLFYATQYIVSKYHNQIFISILLIAILIIGYLGLMRISGLEFYFYESGGWRNIFSMILNATLLCGLGVLFWLQDRARWTNEQNLKLQATNKELQIEQIKSKLNPHFIFNTLNNLNSLIVSRDKNVSDFVNQFSTLLRYSIDEGHQHLISLEKEVECISAYINLLEMQKPLSSDIDFYVEGETTLKWVHPFILTTLVENAIKHSDVRTNEKGRIHISMSVEAESLDFKIVNSFSEQPSSSGKGNDLIREKLQLLYQENFSLNQKIEDGEYHSHLIINGLNSSPS